MKKTFLLFFIISATVSFSQEEVTFLASDGLKVTADLYYKDYNLPFIVLSHQAGSSRGEYSEIAPKLMSLGYNCLAIDLRSGDKINYTENKTALRAKQNGYATKFADAKKDIEAAIHFISGKYNTEKIVLFGSSYSASLSLIIGAENKFVSTVVAFSPGEYLEPTLKVKPLIKKLDKPVFVASTVREYQYIKAMFPEPDTGKFTFYKPSEGDGIHGAKALWNESVGNKECWFYLTQYFDKL